MLNLCCRLSPITVTPKFKEGKGNYRMDFVSQWMDLITQRIQADFGSQSNITRWHLEIRGTKVGRIFVKYPVNILFPIRFR